MSTLELTPIPVTLATFTEQVQKCPVRVTVAFLLAGDGPSINIRAELDQLAMQGRVVTIDAGAEPELCKGYDVTEFPTILLMERGTVRHKIVGYHTAKWLRRAMRGVKANQGGM